MRYSVGVPVQHVQDMQIILSKEDQEKRKDPQQPEGMRVGAEFILKLIPFFFG